MKSTHRHSIEDSVMATKLYKSACRHVSVIKAGDAKGNIKHNWQILKVGEERYREISASSSYQMVGKKILPKVDMARNGDECTLYKFIKETNPESKRNDPTVKNWEGGWEVPACIWVCPCLSQKIEVEHLKPIT